MYVTGRIIFGAAMVGFGILCLAWLDFVSALQPVPGTVPGQVPLAVLTGVFLIATGLAVAADYRARAAALALACMLALWIVLLHVPRAFDHLFTPNWWTATFETLALTGAALVMAGVAAGPSHRRLVRAGAVVFGVSLPVFGIQHFMYDAYVASLVPGWMPWPLFWAWFTGVAHAAAGIAIAAGVMARLAGILAGIMYGSWVLILHLPRVLDPPGAFPLRMELNSLFVATAFCGAAWLIAGACARDRLGQTPWRGQSERFGRPPPFAPHGV